MDRREFLKIVGISTATAALHGCVSKNGSENTSSELGPVPTDKMTYRSFPGLGNDKVSLLGYGCMRWPTIPNPNGKGDMIDQEAVNRLVDYAIEHGVNFFDTSPVYVQGWSERATGNALKRHPRESYYVSTKLSNFSDSSRENSLAMYHRSFSELQVDYIDYYLLHSIGGGKGIETFNERFINNGLLDFLLKEREAGRIRNLGKKSAGLPYFLNAFQNPIQFLFLGTESKAYASTHLIRVADLLMHIEIYSGHLPCLFRLRHIIKY